jgi:hypothetical protein
MAVVDARRLAALDIWGTAGTLRRRRVIRAEFVIGATGCTFLGVLVFLRAGGAAWAIVGLWFVGLGVNYAALALLAQSLSRPGALEAELHGLDLQRESRQTRAQQVWIAIPFAVAAAAVVAEVRAHRQ